MISNSCSIGSEGTPRRRYPGRRQTVSAAEEPPDGFARDGVF